MEAYHIDRFGNVDGIVRRSSEDPRPGPREVLMRVRASSLNYRDLMVLKGGGRGPTKLGVVPLSDGAGEVAAIGERVTQVKMGDRIIGTFHPRWFGGPIKRGLPDRPARRQPRWNAGGLRGASSEEALVLDAEPSVLRGSRDPALRSGDRLGGTDRHRRVAAGDTVLTLWVPGGVSVFALAIRPDPGRPGDRDYLDCRKRPSGSRRWGRRTWSTTRVTPD